MVAGTHLRREAGWVELQEVFDTECYEPVYNLRVAEYHTYFVGAEEWESGVWAHNTYKLVSSLNGGDVFEFSSDGYEADWFVPTPLTIKTGSGNVVPNATVKNGVNKDETNGNGNQLQTLVNTYAQNWSQLPWGSLGKAPRGRVGAIEEAITDANSIYAKVGMPIVTYDSFMMGAPLPKIPDVKPASLNMTNAAYDDLKAQHGIDLRKANQQRAASKGDYIHQQIADYAKSNGYQYYKQGIDLINNASGLSYEVMVNGSWSDHNGTNFQITYWRGLQY